MISKKVNKMTIRTTENEKIAKKIFDKIYGIAYYGEHYGDVEKNMGIPYEFDGKGEISEINAKIYDLKCKMAEEFKGKQCDIDDYKNLCELVANYDDLIEKFCYKMFLYGFTLNPKNLG